MRCACLYWFLQALQEDLKQAHRLAEMYREQCVTMETELSQIREEGDVGREIFKVRPAKTLVFGLWFGCKVKQ